MRHLVVGAGEVGTAVAAVLSRSHPTQLRDLEPVDATADVLDVCIPWSESFIEAVHAYTQEHDAGLVVVHSTVPVGTCDAQGWVHSPIRGRHPDLEEGVGTFVKHFGGERAEEASQEWEAAQVATAVHPRAAETEAGKLWELIQYGVQIRTEKAIHTWCTDLGLDPEVVYTAFAHTYNQGYQAIGADHFVRPVLRHVPGEIGGHCVMPMSQLLDHPLSTLVQEGPRP